MYKETKNNIIN